MCHQCGPGFNLTIFLPFRIDLARTLDWPEGFHENLNQVLKNLEDEKNIENEKRREEEEYREFVVNLKASIRARPGVLEFFGPDFMK